jgi:hypothetical protein
VATQVDQALQPEARRRDRAGEPVLARRLLSGRASPREAPRRGFLAAWKKPRVACAAVMRPNCSELFVVATTVRTRGLGLRAFGSPSSAGGSFDAGSWPISTFPACARSAATPHRERRSYVPAPQRRGERSQEGDEHH